VSFTDKTLNCRDCGNEFTFTAGEQEFYAQKGFTNEPTRCQSCRQANKANRGGGGRDSYGSRDRGGGGYGGGARSDREMHTATCSSCGKDAQVPFVPRGDKPIYCTDCFRNQRSSSSSRSRW
jgi:CxxC-x17-CxxC domain-containing protein